ncbi:MAG: hypothetical protein KC591_16925 [Gemmatimonadetes bacterium]|nr:hypothetical protein [Gemmatimonadota bacterium]
MTAREFLARRERAAVRRLRADGRKLATRIDREAHVTQTVRAHPILALAVGAGAGWLLGGALPRIRPRPSALLGSAFRAAVWKVFRDIRPSEDGPAPASAPDATPSDAPPPPDDPSFD